MNAAPETRMMSRVREAWGDHQIIPKGYVVANSRNVITVPSDAALEAVYAAVRHAKTMCIPQCIYIIDRSGETLASFRMDGAILRANGATGSMPTDFGLAAGIASQAGVTHLPGGLPIRFSDELADAIGVGSGTGEQDFEVARAALSAIGADPV